MPGSWRHLSGRFFGSVGARDLDAPEAEEVTALLSDAEMDLFMRQAPLDRRHGYTAARFALDAGASEVVVRAAALHDVAKRHADLGILGRVVASVCIKLRLPVRGRFRTYRDHGPIGAAELAAAGAPAIAVSYARSHHGAKPVDIDVETWTLLNAADAASERSQSVRSDR
jgi:hypothetical protein